MCSFQCRRLGWGRAPAVASIIPPRSASRNAAAASEVRDLSSNSLVPVEVLLHRAGAVSLAGRLTAVDMFVLQDAGPYEDQYDLEAAEMFTSRLSALYRGVLDRRPTIVERAQARAYIGHIASLSRACVNQLFEASSSSHTLLAADIQRYFRDINVLHQHPAIQPNSCDEIYDRVLAGVDPNSEIV